MVVPATPDSPPGTSPSGSLVNMSIAVFALNKGGIVVIPGLFERWVRV